MSGSAHLSDPGIVRDLRQRVQRFQQQVGAALAGAPTALSRAQDLLRFELGPHWKRELGRRQEAFAEARRKWLEAEAEVKARGRRGQVERPSSEDERRDMLKAQRRVQEAEEKLAAVKTWLNRLDTDGKDLLGKCRDHEATVHEMGDKACTRLDGMVAAIEDYLRRSGGGP